MSYDNTNSGAIFKNDRKEKDTHPDYKGSLNVEGVDYWVSSWIKKGPKGTFMSMALTAKDAQKAPPANSKPMQPANRGAGGSTGFSDMDDDIPFNDPMKNRAFTWSF
jgi:hypothetical protein